MKTFTATQLNKAPQEIFAAAKEDGTAYIKHDRHGGGFTLSHTLLSGAQVEEMLYPPKTAP